MIRNRRLFRSAFLLLVALCVSGPAWSQPADNASSGARVVEKADNPYAGMNAGEIQSNEEEKKEGEKTPESPFVPGAGAMAQMLLWLGLIIVAVYGGVYLFRRCVPSARNMFGGGALKVIGRTYLGPKTYILLVKVGSRLVMVGVSGTQMSPLSEITNPEEVTAVTNELAAASSSFGRTLKSRSDEIAEYGGAETPVAAERTDSDVREMREALEDITQKMNWWRKSRN